MAFIFQFCAAFVLLMSMSAQAGLQREPELKSLEHYSRLVFPMSNGGSFKVQGKSSGGESIKISLERTRLDAWPDLASLNDVRIQAVQATPNGQDGGAVSVALKGSDMDYFAYLQAAPPAVIVDIWPKNQTATNATATMRTAKTKPIAIAQSTKKAIARAEKQLPLRRGPASVATGPKHVPLEPLSKENDFFERFTLPMPALEAKGESFQLPPQTDIENHWEFGKQSKNKTDPRSIQYNFAIGLFKQKKMGLCIKTLDILERDFPDGPYIHEQHFLRALAIKRLGDIYKNPALVARANIFLRELMTKLDQGGKALPFSSDIRLYFTGRSYQEHQWIEAIEQFEFVVKQMKQSDPDYPLVSLGLADAYRSVGQTNRAERIYRYVSELNQGKPLGKEALYRIGVVLAIEQNHVRASEELERALQTYPEYATTRTEVHFILGESYFWTGKYQKSRAAFQEFVKRNPSQTIAAKAYIRLGEIAQLTGEPKERARENYRAAINGFPFSEGAIIASLRLGSVSLDMEPDMSYHMSTLRGILKKKDLPSNVQFMAKLLLVNSLRFSGDTELAMEEAQRVMSETTGTPYELFRRSYVLANGEHLQHLVDEQKYTEALAHYQQKQKWLDVYGPETLRLLADTYRGLGLVESSTRYTQQYVQATNPKALHSRSLASVNEGANLQRYFADENFTEVLRILPAQPTSMEEVYMGMVAKFRLKQYADAYRLADKAKPAAVQLGQQALLNVTEVLVHRALEDKNFSELETILDSTRKELSKPDARMEYLYADALWYQKKYGAAVKSYESALGQFAKDERAERSRYNLAMSYIELGKRLEGVKLLTELRAKSQSVWSLSAKQELELLDWESKYSSVLRSLPPSGLGIIQ